MLTRHFTPLKNCWCQRHRFSRSKEQEISLIGVIWLR